MHLGIDWSEKKHDIAYMNPAGAVVAQQTIAQTVAGFQQLEEKRQQLGVAAADCLVGLETAHNLLIDFLWSRGYQQVYVIPPSLTKSSRGRYGNSGARSDQSDARLLADLTRTDLARLQPWRPDRLLTQQIRRCLSLLRYQSRNERRTANRLRQLLLRYYPLALSLFDGLSSQITLHFISHYPTPAAAVALSYEAFVTFCQEQGYHLDKRLPANFARLQQAQLTAAAETVQLYQEEAQLLAQELLRLVRAGNDSQRRLNQLFAQHPDRAIFASLPGAGDLLAPALLSHFGDDRQRFASPASLQALAGTCPVTESSGQRRIVHFRQACDHDFRHVCQQWARCSLSQSVWANTYWQQVRPHCHSDNDAYRRLANRWLAVAWKLWQSNQPYDEAYHLQQTAQRRKPRH
jgi:transposase